MSTFILYEFSTLFCQSPMFSKSRSFSVQIPVVAWYGTVHGEARVRANVHPQFRLLLLVCPSSCYFTVQSTAATLSAVHPPEVTAADLSMQFLMCPLLSLQTLPCQFRCSSSVQVTVAALSVQLFLLCPT